MSTSKRTIFERMQHRLHLQGMGLRQATISNLFYVICPGSKTYSIRLAQGQGWIARPVTASSQEEADRILAIALEGEDI